MELVARTDTLHLDTYSMSAGKISGTHGGEKREQELPPRSAGIALTVNPVIITLSYDNLSST